MGGEASWAEEAALFVFGVLGLTFFGHVGQVYQTSAPLWQPLAAWLVLFAPAIALRGSGWLTAGLVALVVTWASWGFADPARPLFGAEARSDAVIGLATALPVLLAPLGAWMDRLGAREGFWWRLEQLGFAYAIACASLVIVASAFGELDGDGLLTFTAQGCRRSSGWSPRHRSRWPAAIRRGRRARRSSRDRPLRSSPPTRSRAASSAPRCCSWRCGSGSRWPRSRAVRAGCSSWRWRRSPRGW